MAKAKQILMAIKPKGKYLGIAVFKDAELIDWRIRRIKEKNMKPVQVVKKAEMIIAGLIDDHAPKVLLLEDPCFSQNSKSRLSNKIVPTVATIGKERGLKVRFFSPTEVKQFICQDEKATKMRVEKKIVTQYYPWLYWRYEADSKKHWYEKAYHTILFDAVALGIYCYHHSNKRDPVRKAA